jgi:hypothetical protein
MQLASRYRMCSGNLFAVNGSTPIERKLAEALAECDRLREENRQIRLPAVESGAFTISNSQRNIFLYRISSSTIISPGN